MNAHVEGAPGLSLRGISSQLTVPLPSRTKFLRELRYDLEELTNRFVADGLSPTEAARRASEALIPDQETLALLERLNASRYQRIMSRFESARMRRIEQWLFAISLGTVAAAGAAALFRAGVLTDPSGFLWPVLGVAAVLLGTCLRKAFALWVKGDHVAPQKGLSTVLFLSGLSVVVGTMGALWDTVVLLAALERAPELAFPLLFAGLARETTLLAVSLVIAMAGAVFWLTARQWIALAEDAHERALRIDSITLRENDNV
jgi:hypothetical protein